MHSGSFVDEILFGLMLSLLYLSRQVSELSVIRPGELSLQFQFLIIKHTVIILGQRLDILYLISIMYHDIRIMATNDYEPWAYGHHEHL